MPTDAKNGRDMRDVFAVKIELFVSCNILLNIFLQN